MKLNDAERTLVEENMKLVYHMANKHYAVDFEFEDLISVGYVGLCKAAHYFNPEKKIKFSTFAGICIDNEIKMYLRKRRPYGEMRQHSVSLADHPTIHRKFAELKDPYEALIPDSYLAPVEDRVTDRLNAQEALRNSSERESRMILLCEMGYTQMEVAAQMEISQAGVSRAIHRVARRMEVSE